MSRGNMRVDVECDGCRRVESFTLCASCFVERVGSRVPGILL